MVSCWIISELPVKSDLPFDHPITASNFSDFFTFKIKNNRLARPSLSNLSAGWFHINGFGFTDFGENWRPTYRAKMSDIEQLKKAISVLEGQRAVLGDDVVEAALQPMRDKLAALEAEDVKQDPRRKLVTVLFTDITGSTHMSQKLDPEDILSFLNGAMERFKHVIEQHDGRVFRFMGDGLKAVFGEDITREDDAERAVRAGLAILEESKTYAKVVEDSTGLSGA